jgi:hypothetical protein
MKKRKPEHLMSAKDRATKVVDHCTQRAKELLQGRGNLPRAELEYVAQKAASLKDHRFQAGIAELIGWGDDERAELETLVAIALEVMKDSTPSKIRAAAMKVEIRYGIKLTTSEDDHEQNHQD